METGNYTVYHITDNVGEGLKQHSVLIVSPDGKRYGFASCADTNQYFCIPQNRLSETSREMKEAPHVDVLVVDEASEDVRGPINQLISIDIAKGLFPSPRITEPMSKLLKIINM